MATKLQEVRQFCRGSGITVKQYRDEVSRGAISMYRRKSDGSSWVDIFDDADAAHAFLVQAVETGNKPWL